MSKSTTSRAKTRKQNAPAAGSAGKSNSDKLLRMLANVNAYATSSAFGPAGQLDVFSTREGVSLRTGSASAGDAVDLVSRGLAHWRRGATSGRERLEITDAGHARLFRLNAGGKIEPFLAQHKQAVQKEVEVEGVKCRVVFDADESPLAWLATRKNARGQALLNPVFFEAGERLRRDLTFAQMMPRTTANWDPSLGGSDRHSTPVTYSETVVAARQRADLALRAVGPEFSGLLMDVCGFLKGLEAIEGERQWPRRSAKLVLEFALSALARHYGLESEARGRARSGGIRHWGSPDYRPHIDPPAAEGA